MVEVCSMCGRCKAASTCLETRIRIEGTFYRPLPWQPGKKTVFEQDGLPRRCPSCGVLPGGFHHVGCILEICPRCRKNWLSCNCFGIKIAVKKGEKPRSAQVLVFPGKGMKPGFSGGGL